MTEGKNNVQLIAHDLATRYACYYVTSCTSSFYSTDCVIRNIMLGVCKESTAM